MSNSSHQDLTGCVVVHIVTNAQTLVMLTDHIAAMEAHGVEYHVLANFDDSGYSPDGKRLHHVDIHRGMFAMADIRGFFQIRRMLKRLRPHVVISSTPKAGLVGGFASRLFARGSHRIFLVRGFRFPTLKGMKQKIVRSMEVLPAWFADRTLGTSPQTVSTLQNLLNKRFKDRVEVTLNGTANGIDMEAFSPDNPNIGDIAEVRARFGISMTDFVVIAVARVCVDKGFIELAEAFTLIQKKHPHAKLLIIGDTDIADPLPPEALSRLNAVSIRAGLIRNKKIPELLHAADVLAFPSHREGFGISAIEAAAMGTPTVASRIGGLQTAVKEGVSGVFHKVGDPNEIAERVNEFIEDPDMLARMSKSAKEYARTHYDRRLYDQFWLDIFKDNFET